MVNRLIEAVRTAQDNVGLVKYPAIMVGSTIVINKLWKWNKERKCVLKTDPPKKAQGVLLGKNVGRLFILQPIKKDISLSLVALVLEKHQRFWCLL